MTTAISPKVATNSLHHWAGPVRQQWLNRCNRLLTSEQLPSENDNFSQTSGKCPTNLRLLDRTLLIDEWQQMAESGIDIGNVFDEVKQALVSSFPNWCPVRRRCFDRRLAPTYCPAIRPTSNARNRVLLQRLEPLPSRHGRYRHHAWFP